MKKIELLGILIAIFALLVGILGLFFNGLYTQQVKDYFEKWFNSSPISTTSPSLSPPIQVSPTATKDLPTVISPPSSPSPIPSQELPNNDSTPAVEASNCNSPNIGVLKSACSFNNRVSYSNQEQFYFFNLDKPSDISIYLDNVTSSVGMRLYVDTNGNGVIDSGESLDSATAYSSAVGAIKGTLGIDKYIVVVKFNNGSLDSATAYSSNAGVIKQRLGADNYFVVIKDTGKNTNYKLTIFAP